MAESLGISRRAALGRLATGAMALSAGPGPLRAQQPGACPDLAGRRISYLVGWSPGGGYDVYSRLLEPRLEAALAAEVVVENIPGAAGVVAARRLSGARPNGRTLGILNGTGLMIAPYVNPAYAPDLATDFTVLARVVDHRQTLAVGAHLGVTTLEEFVALGRRRPIVLGDTGPTTINVLLSALLGDLFGIEVRLVLGFPGSSQIVASVLRGDLDGMVAGEESIIGVDGLVPLMRFMPEGDPAGDGRRVAGLLGSRSLPETRPELFADLAKAREDVRAIEAMIGVGRVIAAPPGLPDGLRRCLEAALLSCLSAPALIEDARRAGRSLDPAPAAEVLRHVEIARRAAARFEGLLQRMLGGAGVGS